MSIILLVGASGSGKTTIGKQLEKDGIPQLTSFTTRPMRKGEVDGVDYYFVNGSDIHKHKLAEISNYNGNYYGLLEDEVNKKLKENDNVYFVTDTNGAKQIVEKYPDDTEYFWLNITVDVMIERMRKRGDSDVQILERVKHAVANKELFMPDNVDCNIITLDASESIDKLVASIYLNTFLKTGKLFDKITEETEDVG